MTLSFKILKIEIAELLYNVSKLPNYREISQHISVRQVILYK